MSNEYDWESEEEYRRNQPLTVGHVTDFIRWLVITLVLCAAVDWVWKFLLG